MHIAIVSDVFPPKCGGAGWSAYYLAQAMVGRGHTVRVIVPKEISTTPASLAEGGWHPYPGGGLTRERSYGDLPIIEFGYEARKGPFLANYSRNERLYPRFAAFLEHLFANEKIDVAHAQHYLSGPPTVMAAHKRGIGSIVTIRDYWPICYWTTLLRGPNEVCPGHNAANLLLCLNNHIADADTELPRTGAPRTIVRRIAGAALSPAAVYMERNLRLKRHWLGQANTVVAVSRYVADSLAPYVPPTITQVIPNFVDMDAVDAALATEIDDTTPGSDFLINKKPYFFFAGKLEPNKGAAMLVDLLRHTREECQGDLPVPPLLIAGSGNLRGTIAAEAKEAGLVVHFLDWIDNNANVRLMAGAQAVLFPSLWPEPLSRVLLEASAAGALIAALDTGGTPDIIRNGETGLLAQTVPELAAKLADVLIDPALAQKIRDTARRNAEQNFSQHAIAGRFEELYAQLCQPH